MRHGPSPDEPVSAEQFLREGRLRHEDGRLFSPTETQLRFIREAAAKGEQLLRDDVEALNANARRLYHS